MIYRDREVESNFFTPRDYQLELLDHACDHNTIVTLPTGSGKTFIAVLLIKEYAFRLAQNNEKAVFIVDKVGLVEQQALHIEHHSSLRVARMSGFENNNWKNKEDFTKFINQYDVLVVIAQIFLDVINFAFFDLSSVALLIFDECHLCLGKRHCYRQIMDIYRRMPAEKAPRILGLTASVINEKVHIARLEITLEKFQQIMCSRLEAVNDLVSVIKYSTKPKHFIIKCPDRDEHENAIVKNVFKKFLEYMRAWVNSNSDVDPRVIVGDAVEKILVVLDDLGVWCAWRSCGIYRRRIAQYISDEKNNFDDRQKRLLKMSETTIYTCASMLERLMNRAKTLEELSPFLSSRLRRLIEIIQIYRSSESNIGKEVKDALCGLVFVKERLTAYCIYQLLRHLANKDKLLLGFIECNFIVGNSGKGFSATGKEVHEASYVQNSILQEFRMGNLNLLIATSVLEEGVDVRNCNLVVRFDPPTNFRSFVQSRGRARKSDARFFLMTHTSDYDRLVYELKSYTQIEEFITKYLRSDNMPVDISLGTDMLSVDEIIPPYIVNVSGAKATMSNAIALVNKYCAKLPSDIFTRLVPQINTFYTERNGRSGYDAELILPINSPVKEAITLDKLMSNKTHARMAVALKTCRILYERGELTNHLQPQPKRDSANLLTDLCADDMDKKKRKMYERKVTRYVASSLPKVGEPCHVYVIEIILKKQISDENNPKKRRLLDPSLISSSFGFLSKEKLPPIPGFPVYQRQGEMMVHLRLCPCQITLTENQLELIKLFHNHIFTDILQVSGSDGFEFKPEESYYPLLVVPLMKDKDNNYILNELMLSSSIRDDFMRPSEEQRRKFLFNEANFIGAVVKPWYRSNHPNNTYYYVADICRDMTPSSAFPDNKFESFNHYFKTKYALEIFDQSQHLLDVDHTSTRKNLTLPRASSMRTMRRSLDPAQRQLLVPELVHIHHLSADYFEMIIALPTIFYRINSLLLSDELRTTVMREAFGKENQEFPLDFEWNELTYPTYTNEAEDLPIKNLEQLRRIANEETFFIDNIVGVWDPESVKDQIKNDIPTVYLSSRRQRGKRPPLVVDDAVNEARAIGGYSPAVPVDIEMSDDEDDAYDIIMDMKESMQQKLPHLSLFDHDEMHATGWDDSQLPVAVVDGECAAFSLPISGKSNEINLTSLMQDLNNTEIRYAYVKDTQKRGGTEQNKLSAVCTGNAARTFVSMPDTSSGTENETEDVFVNLQNYDDNNMSPVTDVINSDMPEICSLSFHESGEVTLNAPSFANDDANKDNLSSAWKAAKTTVEYLSVVPDASIVEEKEYEVFAPMCENLNFSFDADMMEERPMGASPTILLQALTTSSAADGINLERLETIGDSFLKLAVTNCLYHSFPNEHEGRLSYSRSKEVSNVRLHILGRRHHIQYLMEASKFDAKSNWLPPGFAYTSEFHQRTLTAEENDIENEELELNHEELNQENVDYLKAEAKKKNALLEEETGWGKIDDDAPKYEVRNGIESVTFSATNQPLGLRQSGTDDKPGPLPLNGLTQQYIADKSIADAVEALIGAHLIYLGPKGALIFMKWLGISVLTEPPQLSSPLLRFIDTESDPDRSKKALFVMYRQFRFDDLEKSIKYTFGNKAYLIQAFTHASYYKNRITGCYQRLEFLGDAVLDYLITRYFYEHKRQYSPGVLTDLRSALVNNTIFASLAVKYGFHKHFIALCPGLYTMIEKFANLCKSKGDAVHCTNFDDDLCMVTEEDVDEGHEEDIEVPKALGDIFESVAGAVYLDCGMKLDIVWRVFYNLMKDTIEECCHNPPQSPIRELFENKTYKARFTKLERVIETGKVRVTVDVNNVRFTGMGRSYRIAKSTAARKALWYVRQLTRNKKKEKNESHISLSN